MPPQPADTPTDRAALEGELARLRKFQVPSKPLDEVVVVAFFILIVVLCFSLYMGVINSWTGIVGFVIALLVGRIAWYRADIEYRAKHIQLLLNSVPPLQDKLIQKNNTLFKLERAKIVLLVIYMSAMAFPFIFVGLAHMRGTIAALALLVLALSALVFSGLLLFALKVFESCLKKQIKRMEATAERQLRAKEQ